MSPVELIAAALGLANVWLVVKRSVWNFPVALAMCALYLWVFFDAKLYSDSLLQLFFIAINIYGWVAWLRYKADSGEIEVEILAPAERLILIAITALVALAWGTVMSRTTDASSPPTARSV